MEITLQDISKYYGAKQVLGSISLEIRQGERVGLLGHNGAGKSTLLRILSGDVEPDAGKRMVRKGAVIGLLAQAPVYPEDYTGRQIIDMAFAKVLDLKQKMTLLEAEMAGTVSARTLEQYGKLQLAFETLGGYAVEETVGRVLQGLKLERGLLAQPFSALSGGEQTRVMLAQLLTAQPDVLLLDEPTNHLDEMMLEWLEEYIQGYSGTVVIISHDRYFLDQAVDRIIDIVDGQAEFYAGNYSFYSREKEERRLRRLACYEQEQRKIDRLETAARRLHDWARRGDNAALHRQAFQLERRAERLAQTERPTERKSLTATFREKGFSGKEVLQAQDVAKAFGDRMILQGLNFIIRSGDRVALLGANGTGKTTLLRVLLGEEPVGAGSIKIGPSQKIGYLPQQVAFEQPERTVLETIRYSLGFSEETARRLLSRYQFGPKDVMQPVAALSGGEKSRLRLCQLMQDEVNFLVLDEPTNNLDIQSREWLEEALDQFRGTVLFVSHDRYFIARFATRILLLEKGSIAEFPGGYETYREKRLQPVRETQSESVRQGGPEPGAKARVKPAVPQVDIADLESRIRALEAALAELERRMAACGSDFAALARLAVEKPPLEEELAALYDAWLGENAGN